MLIKPSECVPCDLGTKGTGFSKPEGTGANGVLAVGEGLGFNEAKDGLPFRPYAEAGSVLERAFKRSGYDREQFRLYNIVNCHPPNDWLAGAPWEIGAIEHCKVHFRRVVEEMKPKVILALGSIALRTLTGMAGKYQGITHLRGYVLDAYEYGIPVLSTYHPSFIRRGNQNLFGVFCRDMMMAVDLAKNGKKKVREVEYVEYPSADDARRFLSEVRANPQKLLTYDIETDKSIGLLEDEFESDPSYNITQIQFSLDPYTGIAFPWEEPFVSISREIMRLRNKKAGINCWDFDDPRLRHHGFTLNGEIHDLMWAWHHLQPDLPANLQFIASFFGMDKPWKHYGTSKPRFYGCVDVDAPQRIAARIFSDMEKRGVLRGYMEHVYGLWPILSDAANRGMPVNEDKRRELGIELQAAKDAEFERMQNLVPEEVRKVHPKLGYKKVPKEITAIFLRREITIGLSFPVPPEMEPVLDEIQQETGLVLRTFTDMVPGPCGCGATDTRKIVMSMVKGPNPHCPICKGKGIDKKNIILSSVQRWCRIEPFVPSGGATGQLVKYMKHKGHTVPKKFKTGEETTERKELERLSRKTKDPLYKCVLEYRGFEKLKSTYVDGWEPKNIRHYMPRKPTGTDAKGHKYHATLSIGTVHTTWTFRPATGQLSSRGPCIQNSPKHPDPENPDSPASLAKANFRKIVEAPPGFKIVEFDFRSFHALTLGFEAGDKDYMRMARLDIHSFLAAHMLKLPERDNLLSMSDDELRIFFKWLKKDDKRKLIRDKKAKPALLGYGFGLGYRKMYDMNRESFSTQAESKRTIDMLNSAFPKTAKFRDDIRLKAHRESFLLSRHGYLRNFFDVYHWDAKRGMMVPGEDSEKAIAFLPSNDAFGHIKDVMRRLEFKEANKRYGLINQVHDSLIFLCPVNLLDECNSIVYKEMTMPSKVLIDAEVALDGLVADVDVSVGQNWKEMTEMKTHG